MRDICIPEVLYAGRQNARLRRWITLALLIALFLHASLFYGLYYLGLHPLLLFVQPQQEIPDAMQYVLIDDKLTSEEPDPAEQARIRAREDRRSRAQTIDESLPKNGPSSDRKSRDIDFQAGKPMPSEASSPATPSTPAQPTPPTSPVPPTPPTPLTQPTQPVQPVAKAVIEPPAPQEKQPPLPEPAEKTADLAPDLTEDLQKIEALTLPKKADGMAGTVAVKPEKTPDAVENKRKTETTEKPEKPEDAPRKPLQATQRETVKEMKPQEQAQQEQAQPQPQQPPQPRQPQQAPQPQQVALPPAPPTMNIPVKRISSTPRQRGGAIGNRPNSSAAMRAASESLAVLRDRYGAYMDMILKRIQESILIQQQLSPVMFNQGSVVMTFRIDESGRLGTIRYITAEPSDLAAETAAARQVLEDVGRGEPFPPPTPQMLADPDFQKITINFLFVPR